jgi:hypothetical protein
LLQKMNERWCFVWGTGCMNEWWLLWASQCFKHLSKIYQLSCRTFWMSSVQSMWTIFYFHWWIAASTPKSCTKDTTTALRSQPTNWHWQMWVWSQVNQVSRVHSESEKSIQMNSQKMKAIMNWQAPKSVKSVQSFIALQLLLKVHQELF